MRSSLPPTVNPGRHRKVKQAISARLNDTMATLNEVRHKQEYEDNIMRLMNIMLRHVLFQPLNDEEKAMLPMFHDTVQNAVDDILWHLHADWMDAAKIMQLQEIGGFDAFWTWVYDRRRVRLDIERNGRAITRDADASGSIYAQLGYLFDDTIVRKRETVPGPGGRTFSYCVYGLAEHAEEDTLLHVPAAPARSEAGIPETAQSNQETVSTWSMGDARGFMSDERVMKAARYNQPQATSEPKRSWWQKWFNLPAK